MIIAIGTDIVEVSRIAQVLGYVAEPEMVHRTNLVLMR